MYLGIKKYLEKLKGGFNMSTKEFIQIRLDELQSMHRCKTIEHNKLQEIKDNQLIMKIDNRHTRGQLRMVSNQLASIENMILVNKVVIASCK